MTTERRFDAGMRETESDAPGLVLGDDGVVYLVAADGTRTAVGGGGSSPHTRASYVSDPVAIANGANGVMTWDVLNQGDALLDLTDPSAPAVIEAGVYAFNLYVVAESNMTDGGLVTVKIAVDLNGDDYEFGPLASPPAEAAFPRPLAVVPFTWYSPAGGVLEARAYNRDGVQDLTFGLHAFIQRIT